MVIRVAARGIPDAAGTVVAAAAPRTYHDNLPDYVRMSWCSPTRSSLYYEYSSIFVLQASGTPHTHILYLIYLRKFTRSCFLVASRATSWQQMVQWYRYVPLSDIGPDCQVIRPTPNPEKHREQLISCDILPFGVWIQNKSRIKPCGLPNSIELVPGPCFYTPG